MAKGKGKCPARQPAKPRRGPAPRPVNLSTELFLMIAHWYLLSTNFTGFPKLLLLNHAFRHTFLQGSAGLFRCVLPTLHGGVLPALKVLAGKYWKQRIDRRNSIGRVLEGVASGFNFDDDSQYHQLKQNQSIVLPSEKSMPNLLIINIAQQMQRSFVTSIAHTDFKLLSKRLRDLRGGAVNEYSR